MALLRLHSLHFLSTMVDLLGISLETVSPLGVSSSFSPTLVQLVSMSLVRARRVALCGPVRVLRQLHGVDTLTFANPLKDFYRDDSFWHPSTIVPTAVVVCPSGLYQFVAYIRWHTLAVRSRVFAQTNAACYESRCQCCPPLMSQYVVPSGRRVSIQVTLPLGLWWHRCGWCGRHSCRIGSRGAP